MRYHLYWVSEDKHSSFGVGYFCTEKEARAAIKDRKRELLEQCGEDFQKAEIEAGTWQVNEEYHKFGEKEGDV